MKRIKINDFQYVETNDSETINKAATKGLEITDIIETRYTKLTEKQIQTAIETQIIPENIRPEILAKINAEIKSKVEKIATKESISIL